MAGGRVQLSLNLGAHAGLNLIHCHVLEHVGFSMARIFLIGIQRLAYHCRARSVQDCRLDKFGEIRWSTCLDRRLGLSPVNSAMTKGACALCLVSWYLSRDK